MGHPLFLTRLVELQSYELGWIMANVGDAVRIATGKPFGVAGLEVADLGRVSISRKTFSHIEIGDRDEQVRAVVMVHGHDAARLKLEFGGAHAVFDEENFFGTAVKDAEASVFVWMCWIPVLGRMMELVVLQKFNSDIAEGLPG